jgi:hypothetical protein
MKAIMMICNRTFALRTIFGSLAFTKDEPRLVAPQMIPEALQRGVLAVDPDEPLFEKDSKDEEPTDPGSRNAAITRAVENIYARNDPDEFTAGRAPKTIAVAKEAGLAKVGAHEIKAILDIRNNAAYEADLINKRKLKEKAKLEETDPPDNEC